MRYNLHFRLIQGSNCRIAETGADCNAADHLSLLLWLTFAKGEIH